MMGPGHGAPARRGPRRAWRRQAAAHSALSRPAVLLLLHCGPNHGYIAASWLSWA